MPAVTHGREGRSRSLAANRFAPLAGAALLGLAAIAFALAYVGWERRFYYFDMAGYHGVAQDALAVLRGSVAAWMDVVRQSLQQDYNLLFQIPAAPLMLVFGDGRAAFVAILAALYQFPYALAAGALCREAMAGRPRAAFWLGAAAVLLLPPVWPTLLQARPDIGASALLAAALLLWLRDPHLSRGRTILLAGLLIGAAVLFRRPYSYPALALLLTMSGSLALEALLRPAPWRDRAVWLTKAALRQAGVVAVMLAFLFGLAPDYYLRVLATDYGALYQAYERDVAANLAFFARAFGAVPGALALAGLAWGLRRGDIAAGKAWKVVAFALVWLAVWSVFAAQPNAHRTIHALPLVAAMGLAGLALAARRSGRPWVATAAALVLGLNFAAAFWPEAPRPVRWLQKVGLLSVAYPPERSPDYDTVARLVADLRREAAGRPLLVAASSRRFNDDMVRMAERALHPRDGKLSFLPLPHVDTRDRLPFEVLLKAEVLVLAEPFQHHLAPEDQEVVRVLLDMVGEQWPILADFEPMPERYALSGGITVSLWRRTHPTAWATALDTLNRMRRKVTPRPGTQPGWVVLASPFPAGIDASAEGAAGHLHPGRGDDPTLVATLDPAPAGTVRVTGRVRFLDPLCRGVTLRAWRLDAGHARTGAGRDRRVLPGPEAPFELAVGGGVGRIQLALTGLGAGEGEIANCSLRLTGLRVEALP